MRIAESLVASGVVGAEQMRGLAFAEGKDDDKAGE